MFPYLFQSQLQFSPDNFNLTSLRPHKLLTLFPNPLSALWESISLELQFLRLQIKSSYLQPPALFFGDYSFLAAPRAVEFPGQGSDQGSGHRCDLHRTCGNTGS